MYFFYLFLFLNDVNSSPFKQINQTNIKSRFSLEHGKALTPRHPMAPGTPWPPPRTHAIQPFSRWLKVSVASGSLAAWLWLAF